MNERSSSLRPFFTPDRVAVIGAAATSADYGVMRNLLDPWAALQLIYPSSKADEIFRRVLPTPSCRSGQAGRADHSCRRSRGRDRGVWAKARGQGRGRDLRQVREVGAEGVARLKAMVETAQHYGMRVVDSASPGVDTHALNDR